MTAFRRILITTALCVLVSGLASADLIVDDGTQTSTTTNTDWTQGLAFAQFDSSLGTLDSVQVILSSSLQTSLTVTNTDTNNVSSSGHSKTELQVTVEDPSSLLAGPQLDYLSPSFFYSLGPEGSTTSSLLTASTGPTTFTYTDGTILSEFTGNSNITLTGSTFTQTDLSNTGGNTSSSQVTTGNFSADVIYNYTPATTSAPEPASLLLMGSALMGLGFFRKRFIS